MALQAKTGFKKSVLGNINLLFIFHIASWKLWKIASRETETAETHIAHTVRLQ